MTPGLARRLARASDDRLAALAAAGDGDATAALFARLEPELRRYCLGVLGRPEDAADAAQSAVERALVALRSEGPPRSLRPWLFRIAHNEAITVARRRGAAVELTADLVADGPAMDESVLIRERLNRLLADLRALPERQRSALILRELSGLSIAEVADALGTSPAAARQTLYEARLALQDLASGRDRTCDVVRSTLSDGDGRVIRARSVRSHLRACTDCRAFAAATGERRRALGVLFPLPAGVAVAGGSTGTLADPLRRALERLRTNLAVAVAVGAVVVVAVAATTGGDGAPDSPKPDTRTAAAPARAPAGPEAAPPTAARSSAAAGEPRPSNRSSTSEPTATRSPQRTPSPTRRPAPADRPEPREPATPDPGSGAAPTPADTGTAPSTTTRPADASAEPAEVDPDACRRQLAALLADAGLDLGRIAALDELPVVIRCRMLGVDLDQIAPGMKLPDVPVPELPGSDR